MSAHAWRMADLIIARVKAGGIVGVRVNPIRTSPVHTNLYAMLVRKWDSQRGLCALCGSALVAKGSNKMLQPSADRINSANGSYADENVHVTQSPATWPRTSGDLATSRTG